MKTLLSTSTAGILPSLTALALILVPGSIFLGYAATPPSILGLDGLLNPTPSTSPVQFASPIPENAVLAVASADLKAAVEAFRAGEFAQAAALSARVVAAAPVSPFGYQMLGASRIKLGQVDAGIDSLLTASRLAPLSVEPLDAVANAYLGRGNLAEARKYFSLILEQRADFHHAHEGLGWVSEREGKFAEAAGHFETAIKGAPAGEWGSKVNLAGNYNRLGQFDKTIELLAGPVAEIKPTNASAAEMLALAYLGSGKPAEAISTYELAYTSTPSAQLAMGLGISYRSINRLPESLRYLREATASRANWSPAWVQLAETQIALSDLPAALASLEKARAFATETASIEARAGTVHLALKDYPKAIALFERLAGAKDADTAAFDRLASAYQVSGDVPAAERTLKKAVTQFPTSPLPPYKLGLLYSASGRHVDAVAALTRAAALDADNLFVQRALINSYARAGNQPRAIAIAEGLVKKYPASSEAKLFLAALYSQSANDRQAAVLYREILKTAPNHGLALNNLAMIHGRSGEFAEAIALAQRAVGLLPQSGPVLDTLGWLKYQKGDYAEAAGLLRKSSELSPDDPSIFYHLGMAYSKQNEKPAALKAFKSAVALSQVFPEYQQATKMIALLGDGP